MAIASFRHQRSDVPLSTTLPLASRRSQPVTSSAGARSCARVEGKKPARAGRSAPEPRRLAALALAVLPVAPSSGSPVQEVLVPPQAGPGAVVAVQPFLRAILPVVFLAILHRLSEKISRVS